MHWTEDMLLALTQLWNEGHSCSIIGSKLGISKSAVAGAAHRRGLPQRKSPIKGEGPEVKARREAAKAEAIRRRRMERGLSPEPARRRVQTAPQRYHPIVIPLAPPRTCHWPVGEPGSKEFTFCGKEAVVGKPYCADHCKVAYVKSPRNAA